MSTADELLAARVKRILNYLPDPEDRDALRAWADQRYKDGLARADTPTIWIVLTYALLGTVVLLGLVGFFKMASEAEAARTAAEASREHTFEDCRVIVAERLYGQPLPAQGSRPPPRMPTVQP